MDRTGRVSHAEDKGMKGHGSRTRCSNCCAGIVINNCTHSGLHNTSENIQTWGRGRGGSGRGSGIGNAAAHALGGHWSVCEPGDWLGWSVVSVQRLILGLGIRMTTSPEWTIDTEQASHVDWVGGRSLVIQWSSFDNGG